MSRSRAIENKPRARPRDELSEPAAHSYTNEFHVYSDIGASFWAPGVTANDVVAWLRSRDKAAELTVRINSAGGDAFEGIAIHNILRDAPQRIIVKVDGIALSAASIIAMAGDEVRMAPSALMMIHDPWTLAMGDAAELRSTADRLDKVAEAIATTYAGRMEQGTEHVRELMAAETWFSAAEARAAGLIDAVEGEPAPAAEQNAAGAWRAADRPWIRHAYAPRVQSAVEHAPAERTIVTNSTGPIGTIGWSAMGVEWARRAAASFRASDPTEDTVENEKTKAELVAAQAQLDTVRASLDQERARVGAIEAKVAAFEAQNAALAAERDALAARLREHEEREAVADVDALVGVKFTAAEREGQIKLRKSDPELFRALAAQRADMTILRHNPIGASGAIDTAPADAGKAFVAAVNAKS